MRSVDNCGLVSSYSGNSSGITVDVSAPTFSVLTMSAIGETVARVSWTTNEDATTILRYGTIPGSYGQSLSAGDDRTTTHEVSLTNLVADTNYYVRAEGVDGAANTGMSSEQTFTTSTVQRDSAVEQVSEGVSSQNTESTNSAVETPETTHNQILLPSESTSEKSSSEDKSDAVASDENTSLITENNAVSLAEAGTSVSAKKSSSPWLWLLLIILILILLFLLFMF